jgi:hypothetical protein
LCLIPFASAWHRRVIPAGNDTCARAQQQSIAQALAEALA